MTKFANKDKDSESSCLFLVHSSTLASDLLLQRAVMKCRLYLARKGNLFQS